MNSMNCWTTCAGQDMLFQRGKRVECLYFIKSGRITLYDVRSYRRDWHSLGTVVLYELISLASCWLLKCQCVDCGQADEPDPKRKVISYRPGGASHPRFS